MTRRMPYSRSAICYDPMYVDPMLFLVQCSYPRTLQLA